LEPKPDDAYFEKFQPVQAPKPGRLLLQKGDRLAICGDSITEQKMYSRVIETYLTVCVPELEITVRQFGWGGETASGFLARVTNDCLRFQPTIATTCYGMNDHRYRPYEEAIGERYREKSTSIVRAFKAAGARVMLGSPGCVGPRNEKDWDEAGVEAKNLSLCQLRNIDVEIARAEEVAFADVFWPMLKAGFHGGQKFGPNYAISGRDGVHPGWAGSFVMACAFLKAFGLDGEIGTFTVDLQANEARLSPGHELVSFHDGELRIKSSRYPFCATGSATSDNSIRSAMSLVLFHAELNRLTLAAKNGSAARYKVTWGDETRSYSAEQLAQGVNLAEDFEANPFSAAFAKVDGAVAAKQAYETRQIKDLFHGPEGRADIETTVALTEKARAPLAAAIKAAFKPVTHSVRIVAE
jgi:hypothetical protein